MMALSNKFAGSFSPLATRARPCGLLHLYGDMAGGFAVIKDVPKTMVYALFPLAESPGCSPVIPESVIIRPPSAELRPNQTDQDTPAALRGAGPHPGSLRRGGPLIGDIVALGYDEATVRQVVSMVDRNEYKRRQAPPGEDHASRIWSGLALADLESIPPPLDIGLRGRHVDRRSGRGSRSVRFGAG